MRGEAETAQPIRPLVATPPAPGETLEVAPGVLWLRLALPFRLDHVNVYLLRESGADDGAGESAEGWAAVDTGIDDEATRAAWTRLLQDGALAGARLTRLVVTHFHPDHFGAAAWLAERHGLTLEMSASEYLTSALLQSAPITRERAGYRAFYRGHGLDEAATDRILGQGHRYLSMVSGLPESYRRLMDGQRLTIGARRFDLRTGAGHAPEQVMLHDAAGGLFLAADQVLAKISPNISVWPREPEDDPLGRYLASLDRLAAEIPADVLVLPGHGLPFRGLHARIAELKRHHAQRCRTLLAACRAQPLSVMELIPLLFARKLDGHESSFAFGEALAHANHLLATGELTLRRHADGVLRFRTA